MRKLQNVINGRNPEILYFDFDTDISFNAIGNSDMSWLIYSGYPTKINIQWKSISILLFNEH